MTAAARDSAETRDAQCDANQQHSYGIAQAREVEISHLDRRYGDRLSRLATFTRAHSNRPTHRLEIVQHEDRRVVEPQILHCLRDPSILDQERSIAREARVRNRALIG